MSIFRTLLIAIIMVFAISNFAMADCFDDVKEGSKHFITTCHLKELGIINGYPDNTFQPKHPVNRAEAVKMLMLATGRFAGEEIKNMELDEKPFNDTPLEAWYTPYIAVAKENGIIQGIDDNFLPGETVNLVEALKIYIESFENQIYPPEFLNHFEDVDENAWYAPYLRYADARFMLEIFPSNKVYPFAPQTRGELADLIYKKKISAEGQFEFGKATFYGKAVQGHYTASGEIFDYTKMTAAHKTLPFGTIVKVTNLANGKSVNVRITDRGPYGPGRIIDLSEGAFATIAWLGTGVIHAELKIISTPD